MKIALLLTIALLTVAVAKRGSKRKPERHQKQSSSSSSSSEEDHTTIEESEAIAATSEGPTASPRSSDVAQNSSPKLSNNKIPMGDH
ncbi:hypothetical protein Q1695_003553 [Nippostrongylus brasiliensis]|nr:hypothetical protein Q1695_003553 [Nippostrongylus brasiliensis]